MSLPVPVTGDDRCPTCEGKRVMLLSTGKAVQAVSHREAIDQMRIYDDGGVDPYGWCVTCRGEGTTSAAMEILLIK